MGMFSIALETWTLLRRHKIVLPIVFAFAAVCFVGSLGSGLLETEFRKMMFDVGLVGFHLAGGAIAIFWGTKAMSDAYQEGSLEVQLASPLSRTSWLLGKFFGLVLALIMLGLVFCALWQASMLVIGFGWMNGSEMLTIATMGVAWLVIASLVILFATFASLPVSVFGCTTLWAIGMSASYFSQGSTDESGSMSRWLGRLLGDYWNLRRLNLGDYLYKTTFPSLSDVMSRMSYGMALVVLILVLACGIFERRDLIR